MEPGPELDVHLGACAARIRDALDRLPGLKRYAVVKQSDTGLPAMACGWHDCARREDRRPSTLPVTGSATTAQP